MKHEFHLKVPTAGFTFKPAVVKQKRIPSSYKPLTKILYCIAHKDDNGEWKAYVDTKGIEGYKDLTILPFTDKSFELRKRINVFYHKKDKNNCWTRIIRTDVEAEFYPGNPETYCTLCENCVFSGHIVRLDGKLQFDMSVYQGTLKERDFLLSEQNRIIHDDK